MKILRFRIPIAALAALLSLNLFADDTSRVLDCWADALGGRPRLEAIVSVEQTGTFETGGLSGTFHAWRTARGDSRSDVTLGDYRATEAFSGGSGWSQEGSAPAHDAGPADLRRLASEAYLESFSMFFTDRMPGTVELRGKDPTSGNPILRIQPEGGLPITVTLDASTCLPRTIETPDRDRTQTQTIAAWKTFAGIRFPGEITQSTGDPKFDAVIRLDSVTAGKPIDEALFERPEVGSGIAWPDDAHAVTLPIELTQNHIFVPVRIDGKATMHFVLDTGADMTVVAKERADGLGLDLSGSIEARGAGSGSVQASIVKSPSVTLGGIEMRPDLVFAIPLEKLSLREGRPLEGILGYDILSRFVVEIDYAARKLTLIDPAKFKAPAAAQAIPVEFDGNTPTMKVGIVMPDGKTFEGRVSIDTGNRSPLILSRPFVEKNDLIAASGNTIDAPHGMGVGGATHQRIGRIAKLRIGPFELADVVTSFSTDESGANADPNQIGNVGGGALRRFVLWVDYPHKRVLLAPGKDFDEPFEFDMSGILFEYADAKFERVVVSNVLADSPAGRSGVKAGDVLTAIDGKASSGLSLDAIRATLRKPGERHTLTLERDGKTVEVSITTRRLV